VERIICEKEPPRPSVYRSELHGDLDNIVLLAMRKEPDRRYARWSNSRRISSAIAKTGGAGGADTVRYRAEKIRAPQSDRCAGIGRRRG